jgi:tetratricopeptide (TPR) repeat protein
MKKDQQGNDWFKNGNRLLKSNRYEEAIGCYDQDLKFDPRNALALYNKALCEDQLGLGQCAYMSYSSFITLAMGINPEFVSEGGKPELKFSQTEPIFVGAERIDHATQRITELQKKGCSPFGTAVLLAGKDLSKNERSTSSEQANTWYDIGFSFQNQGNKEEALRCYDQALRLDPRFVLVWYLKGLVLGRLGNHAEAIRCLDKALELDPRNKDAWYHKGDSLASLGRHEEAIHCYDQALKLNPRTAMTWYKKGDSLASLGRHEEAIHCYDQSLEFDQLPIALYKKGNSLNSLDCHEEAIRCYDQALELNPSLAHAWNNKGYSLNRLGRNEEAIRCCDQALELDPRHASAWYTKASAEDELGQSKEAVRSYRQFLAVAPAQKTQEIEHAHLRIRELEGG